MDYDVMMESIRKTEAIRAAYASRRGWYPVTLKSKMLADDYMEMYRFCWLKLSAPRLHTISHFDDRLEERCQHQTYTEDSESLPGSQARKYSGNMTFYIENIDDAALLKVCWGKDFWD